MVDNAPCVSQVIPELIKFIGKNILAAHNVGFDNKFLLSESHRLGLVPKYKDLLCSVKLSRRVLYGLPSYKLTNLAASLGIKFNGRAHRAEADAEVAAKVLIYIGHKIKTEYGIDSFDPDILVSLSKLNVMQIDNFLKNIFLTK